MYKEIALFAENIGAEVICDAPMKKYTSFKCGGNASVLIIPDSLDNLNKIIDFSYSKGVKPFIIGNGSNLLVTDKGINGVVIKIGSQLSEIKLLDETTIYCEAGASLLKAFVCLHLKIHFQDSNSLLVFRVLSVVLSI